MQAIGFSLLVPQFCDLQTVGTCVIIIVPTLYYYCEDLKRSHVQSDFNDTWKNQMLNKY